MDKIISAKAISRRNYWVNEIRNISGNFVEDYNRLATKLRLDTTSGESQTIIEHLGLCGSIPESYGHDSREEKLYSKYTDTVLSYAFQQIGFKSHVIIERTDAADVEVVDENYSFIADAKALRLSRSAKNQKDFKIQVMHGWKRGKPFAMVVCPIYQLPSASSQIYQSATHSNVCIFTYSHLALIINFSQLEGVEKSRELILKIFKTIPALNPSKNATDYWIAVNRTMLEFSETIENLWGIEKQAATESVSIAKEEDLTYLSQQREAIMRMTHNEALSELIKMSKIDSKIRIINTVRDSGIFMLK